MQNPEVEWGLSFGAVMLFMIPVASIVPSLCQGSALRCGLVFKQAF